MSTEDFPDADVPVTAVSLEALRTRVDAGDPVTILDVRAPAAYQQWHVEGESVVSINVPHYRFFGEVDEDVTDAIPRDRTVTVVCARGGASEFVAGTLAELGYEVEHLGAGTNGWARIYEAREVTGYDGAGTLYQYHRPSSGCLAYLLHVGDEAAVIDPLRAFADRYRADAADLGADLVFAFDTHVHADHVSGVRELAGVRDLSGVRELDGDPGSGSSNADATDGDAPAEGDETDDGEPAEGDETDDGDAPADVESVLPAAAIDRGVTYAEDVTAAEDGDAFAVGDATIEAVHTPGHTTGMTSYLLDGSFLATGDGLFVESVARPDLEAGDEGAADAARMLHESLHERILALPGDTVIGGAHVSDAAEPAADGTYTATIDELVAEMGALSLDEEAFVEFALADVPPRPANYEEIVATNLGRNEVDDEAAFSLELGPNNCAASRDSLAGD